MPSAMPIWSRAALGCGDVLVREQVRRQRRRHPVLPTEHFVKTFLGKPSVEQSIEHSIECSIGMFDGMLDGMFDGVFDGMFDEMFDGVIDGMFDEIFD